MAFIKFEERNPDDFKQEELPLPEPIANPIVPVPGGAVLQQGDFTSPNFRHLRSGWKVDSKGNAEFQSITAAGVPFLLKSNQGTSTNVAAHNVDTVAISGLTAKDRILVYLSCSALANTVTDVTLYSTTDAINLMSLLNTNGIAAGTSIGTQVILQQEQQDVTTIAATWFGVNGAPTATRGNANTPGVPYYRSNAGTTSWQALWTLALRSAGVTAGGTWRWSWQIYKIPGQ